MITAKLLFRRDGEDVWLRGTYEFLQLPSAGDRVVVTEDGGLTGEYGVVDTFEVLYLEHYVTAEPGGEPAVIIVVDWLSGAAA